jgi:hypothetical protein
MPGRLATSLADRKHNQPGVGLARRPVCARGLAQTGWYHRVALLNDPEYASGRAAIGLILWKSANETIVEYSLRDHTAPIQISEHRTGPLPAPTRTRCHRPNGSRRACATFRCPHLVSPTRHKYRQTAPETVWLLVGG